MGKFNLVCKEVREFEVIVQAQTAEEAIQKFQQMPHESRQRIDRQITVQESTRVEQEEVV
ncbi:TPA: hypothetical protein QCU33_005373 [Bacillus cereus]|nr:hypothetical protein [Bacillus cereus]